MNFAGRVGRRCAVLVVLSLLASTAHAQSSVLDPWRPQLDALTASARHGEVLALLEPLLAAQPRGASPGAAEILLAQTLAYNQLGKGKLGMETARKAWQMRAELFGATDPRTLDALDLHLKACGTAGASAAASCLPQAAEAVGMRQAAGEPRALAQTLFAQINLANQAGRLDLALPQLALLLQVQRNDPSTRPADLVETQRNHAVLLQNAGRYREALAALDQLLETQPDLAATAPLELLKTLTRRARVLDSLGQSAKAGPQWQEALRLCAAQPGTPSVPCAEQRLGMGAHLLRAGRAEQAVSTLRQLSQELQRDAAPRLGSISRECRYYLALALRQAGLHADSLAMLQAVLDEQSAGWGEAHPDYVTYLQAHAAGLQLLGRAQDSQRQFERALALGERLRGPRHPQVLVHRLNAWVAATQAGQPVDRMQVQQLAQQLLQSLGAEHPSSLQAQQLQAELDLRAGETAAALQSLERLLSTRQTLLGVTHPDSLRTQATLARAQRAAGRPADALQTLDALVPQLQQWRRALAGLGPSAQRQAPQALQSALVLRAELLMANGQVEAALQAVEAYKAQDLLLQLSRQRALEAAAPSGELGQQLRELAQARSSMEAQLGQSRFPQQRESLALELQTLHQRYEAVLQSAAAQSPRLAALLQPEATGLADLRLLPRRSALLHYLRGPDEQWHVLVLRPDRAPQWFALGRWSEHQPDVERLRVWGSQAAPRGPEALASSVMLRQTLGERLLQPLLGALDGVDRLLISPDGTLGLLPWDTLLVAGQSALQRWTVSQLASLAVSRAAHGRAAVPAPLQTLSLGASLARQEGEQAWPALPYAAQEASAVARLYPGPRSRLLLGQAASESRLRELNQRGELARFQLLHVAAHGRLDERNGPTLLLGRSGNDESADGLLVMADWMGLRLGSRLTVLSACDTAQGQALDGEGLVGLAYALQLAGNRELLGTLWPVSDAASAAFVPAFLARVKRGQGHAQALAATKREFAASADPRLSLFRSWAGFVLVGRG